MNAVDKSAVLLAAWRTRNTNELLGELSAVLALLTGSNATERERAKQYVRGYIKRGQEVEAKEAEARKLENFANRSEPGSVAP